MTTKTNQKKIESNMYYIETADWKKGAVIMTVAVGEKDQPKNPVGYITLDGYNENQKPVFSSRDLEGHPIFETTVNLYQLKRRFKDNEVELTQAMEEYEISREALMEELQERVRREEDPERDNHPDNDVLLDQPIEDAERTENAIPIHKEQRELHVVHRKKEKNKQLVIER